MTTSSSSSYFVPSQFPITKSASSSHHMDHDHLMNSNNNGNNNNDNNDSNNNSNDNSVFSLVLDDRNHVYTNLCKILKEYAFVVVYLFTGHHSNSTTGNNTNSASRYYKKYRALHTEFLHYKHFTDPRKESWYTGGNSSGSDNRNKHISNIKNIYQMRISPNLKYFHFNYLITLCIFFLVYISYFNFQPLLFCVILFAFVYFAIVYRLIFPKPQYQTLTFNMNSKLSWSIIQHLTWIYNKVKTSVLSKKPNNHLSESTDQSFTPLHKSITLSRQQYCLVGYCICTLSILLFTGGIFNLLTHVLFNTFVVSILFILPHAILYNPVYHVTTLDQAV